MVLLCLTHELAITMKSFVLIGLLLLCLVGCQRPSEPPSTLSEPEASVSANGIVFTLRLPRIKFYVGDTLKGKFEVWNNSTIERTFFFLNRQQLALEIQLENGEVVSALSVASQLSAGIFRLATNQRQTYPFAFVPRSPKTGGALQAGTYWLCAYLSENHSPKVRLRISIEPSPGL
jgi:hypothetical protein